MMTRDLSVAEAMMSLVSESSCNGHTECEAGHNGDQMVQGHMRSCDAIVYGGPPLRLVYDDQGPLID